MTFFNTVGRSFILIKTKQKPQDKKKMFLYFIVHKPHSYYDILYDYLFIIYLKKKAVNYKILQLREHHIDKFPIKNLH